MERQDIGSDDAAIYNAGAIEISGDSMFLDIKADNWDDTKARRTY